MPRGPLPKPDNQRRRRNAPTIPTTDLPAGGRRGKLPRPPEGYRFGPAGQTWWKWAWHTPQAAAWCDGDLYVLGRRALLEDDHERLKTDCDIDSYEDLLTVAKALAGADTAIMREMRELDDRLGLTPKGLAMLRWRIVEDDAPATSNGGSDDDIPDRRDSLHVVA